MLFISVRLGLVLQRGVRGVHLQRRLGGRGRCALLADNGCCAVGSVAAVSRSLPNVVRRWRRLRRVCTASQPLLAVKHVIVLPCVWEQTASSILCGGAVSVCDSMLRSTDAQRRLHRADRKCCLLQGGLPLCSKRSSCRVMTCCPMLYRCVTPDFDPPGIPPGYCRSDCMSFIGVHTVYVI